LEGAEHPPGNLAPYPMRAMGSSMVGGGIVSRESSIRIRESSARGKLLKC
jgi:hypothetical protein